MPARQESRLVQSRHNRLLGLGLGALALLLYGTITWRWILGM
jgi:hypothetical protein